MSDVSQRQSVFDSPKPNGEDCPMPEDQTTTHLLGDMVREQKETNRRLAKIEVELLGREADRGTGLVFRLADVENSVRSYRKLSWMIAGAVVVLLVTRMAQLLGHLPL